MTTLEFKWGTSRGRDTYGYTICTLYTDGSKVSSCNGGGYDMKGTALGRYIARAYADRLNALRPEQMPEQSHWERAREPRRLCCDTECMIAHSVENAETGERDLPYLAHDVEICPHCGTETRMDTRDGRTVDDGRYFYGLTFHDPDFDPGKAVIGRDTSDRTFGGAEGETIEQAEAEGKSLGLERYQAFYSASSKVPTSRHTVPSIDGACGFSSVERIMEAIGLKLEWIKQRSHKTDLYRLIDETEAKAA